LLYAKELYSRLESESGEAVVYKRSRFGYNQFKMVKKSLIPGVPEKGYISVHSEDTELIQT
jgi:hypothetical protein